MGVYIYILLFFYFYVCLALLYLFLNTSHYWISLCEIVFDHFSITLCLSIYLYPIQHFFLLLALPLCIPVQKIDFLILVWSDAVLILGMQKVYSSKQQVIGLLSGQGFVNFSSHPPRLQFHKSSSSGQRSLPGL